MKVLGAMGIDVVAHIPAQDVAAVLSLFGDVAATAGSVVGGKPQKLRGGVGLTKLNFSKARFAQLFLFCAHFFVSVFVVCTVTYTL